MNAKTIFSVISLFIFASVNHNIHRGDIMQYRKKLVIIAFSIILVGASASTKASAGMLTAPTPVVYSDNTLSVKTILAQLGYIPEAQVNGYMDVNTRGAITVFQQQNNLKADGLIDPKTAQLLNARYTGELATPAPGTAQIPPQRIQERSVYSSDVLDIEKILYKLQFLTLKPAGYMNPKVRAAISNFQASAGLPANGEVDKATANALNAAYENDFIIKNEHPCKSIMMGAFC
jgi:peptidoglycan hydrolase-like protein with peptidoglycan-binding domain